MQPDPAFQRALVQACRSQGLPIIYDEVRPCVWLHMLWQTSNPAALRLQARQGHASVLPASCLYSTYAVCCGKQPRPVLRACITLLEPCCWLQVFAGLWRLGVASCSQLLGVKPDIAAYAKLLTGAACSAHSCMQNAHAQQHAQQLQELRGACAGKEARQLACRASS